MIQDAKSSQDHDLGFEFIGGQDMQIPLNISSGFLKYGCWVPLALGWNF